MIWKHYHIAVNIADALAVLRHAQGSACPIGGGTDLLLEIQQGRRPPVDTLIDLTRIPELNCLEMRANRLFIGAGVPVSRLATHPLVLKHARAVGEACALIGGPQVRNTATLGGNVAHALPAADGMIALVAMDAEAVIAMEEGLRVVPMLSLFRGAGKSTLDPRRELLVGFYINARQDGEGCAFQRVMRPQGVALPVLNMAVWLRRQGGRIIDVRISVGPAGPTPQRATPIEEMLSGRDYSSTLIDAATPLWQSHMHFRSSPQRASTEYRHHLAAVLFREVMEGAWFRSFETQGD
jgi:carbon-monoxide dehydrogenase medium subunit